MRFPEFSGEWKSIKLGDALKLKGGYAFKSEKFQDSGVPVVRISNLPQNSYSVDLSDCVYYECGNYQNYTVKNGDLLIAMSGATTGKTAIYRYDYPAYLNQRVGLFAPKELVHNQFLYPIVESKTFISQLGSKLVAGAQPNISSQDIETIAVGLPSKEEQIKIAHLFELLNQKIETQSKIIEEQETLLRSLRHKLFNQCLDSHTQCRIGDILSIGSGKDYQHLREGEIPVYVTGGLISHVNESLYDGESVCIGRKGTINKPLYLSGRFWTVDTLFYTHSFNGILPRFCYHLFCTIDWLTYNEASGVPSLSKSTIEKILVSIPQIDIQKRIVQILDSIEEKINIDRNTLLDYQKQKIYLLSRMFI